MMPPRFGTPLPPMNPQSPRASFGRMALFFVPLVLTVASQALTYPFVASIVSHGPLGTDELSAYAMGQSAMFLFGSIGAGMITTGMMFCRSLEGLREFRRLNLALLAAAVAPMLVVCLPGPDRLVFTGVYGLERPELVRVARNSLLLNVPLQTCFFLRNASFAELLLARRSDLVNLSTLVRVGLACLFAWLFVRLGWTGHAWGAGAMFVPGAVESALVVLFARRHRLALPERDPRGIDLSAGRQLRFTLPLSLGGMLMWATAILDYHFLMLSGEPGLGPEAAQAAGLLNTSLHVLVFGIVNTLALSAMQLQNVAISFPPADAAGRRRLAAFALLAGLALAAAILALALPEAPARWYYCTYQNLATEHLPLARTLSCATAVLPVLYVFMGVANGLAANAFKSRAILCGQAAYFLTMFVSLLALLALHVLPGWSWGLVSIACGTVAATAATALAARVLKPLR